PDSDAPQLTQTPIGFVSHASIVAVVGLPILPILPNAPLGSFRMPRSGSFRRHSRPVEWPSHPPHLAIGFVSSPRRSGGKAHPGFAIFHIFHILPIFTMSPRDP